MAGSDKAKAAEESKAPKVRGRGACKFVSAFSGSGLLAWTNDDPESKPSKEAHNPRRGGDDDKGRGRQGDAEEADGRSRKSPKRRRRSEEASPGRGGKRRRRSESPRRRRSESPRRRRSESPRGRRSESPRREKTPERKPPPKPKPRTQWVRVINVPTVVQSKHLQHLFKNSLGGVMSCEVDDGIASACFETPELAERAVAKYNGGEINGCTISVQLDFAPKKSGKEGGDPSAAPAHPRAREAAGQSPKNGRRQ